ncbi:NACHT domain-containing protein [Vibrio splendidus]|uniref:NACHT domain-containing protein n=1 Tax=Vibrio splendidus TaxID=29497 RepID=UPI00246960CA|nr:hypothetical protein [Vibrio splendidus]MDH6024943.1 hypothetical protein [Vibrio splendidus]
MTGLEFAAPALGKLIIGKVFGEGIKRSESFLKKLNELNNREKSVQSYLKAVEKIKRVRTLSYTDKDALFNDIYVPLNVTSSTNTNYLIDENVAIPQTRAINIVGRAGQGKSTILRRLFLNELSREERIPILLELKYFREDSLEKNLINELRKWGLNFDETTVLEFATSSEVSLYLDAFDEIPTVSVDSVYQQLCELKNSCDCKITITSRPNTNICHTDNIDTFQVSDLTDEQVYSILNVASSSKNQSTMLKQALEAKPHALEFVKSPILAVLLQIVFAHSNTVPSSLNDFYNRVYLTLFHRHDELKTNVSRGFKTNLTCDESERVFQTFCYLSLKSGDLSFSKEVALKHMSTALKVRGFDEVKSENYFNDVFHVTNIIQEDGYDNYTFFHRSLQEFYAYKFIDGFFSNEQKKQFFELCSKEIQPLTQFNLVIRFFADNRESKDYLEHFVLPVLGYFIGSDLDFNLEAAALRFLGDCTIKMRPDSYLLPDSPSSEENQIRMVSTTQRYEAIDLITTSHLGKSEDFESISMRLLNSIHKKAFRNPKGESWNLDEIAKKLGIELIEPGILTCEGDVFFQELFSANEKKAYFLKFKGIVEEYDLISLYKRQKASFDLLSHSASKLFFDGF